MSLTHTLSNAPRLCRRQTSVGFEQQRRSASPQRHHMRLVSAYAALPSTQELSSLENGAITPPRKRSSSASWSPLMRSPNPSRPQSPLSINLPSPYASSPPRSRVVTPYSPRSPYPSSPRTSYFPPVPASPPPPAHALPGAPRSPTFASPAAAAPLTPHVLPPTPQYLPPAPEYYHPMQLAQTAYPAPLEMPLPVPPPLFPS
ncbi:hypothetical protein EXIGLDRAFT_770446, partial [Exidia glandulosa HHB12029]